jgi:peptidoglycan/LPS O-acetylase OafA/YrhL
MNLKYRADIDGLRAIAILLVIIFHTFPSLMKGGFIGVDVFFVISGFLISKIIFLNLHDNTFSFTEFYTRRINRIFPALIIMLLISLILGWFTLTANEYRQLGKHIIGGATFVSNFISWKEIGYFDNAADTKPLLHLWSLGIEEQFYIVWPFILWVSWKKKINLLLTITFIFLVSIFLFFFLANYDASATFYSPPTRFWEILLGGLLAYIKLYKSNFLQTFDKHQNAQSIIGISLILFSAFFIQENIFLGAGILLPTLGTFLILSADQSWINRIILSNRVLVWIGLISYPLYLWHWPLLSFARIISSDMVSDRTRIFIIILSIILAWLTYKFIETPVYLKKYSKSLMLLMGVFGCVVFLSQGLTFREVVKINFTHASGDEFSTDDAFIKKCQLKNETTNNTYQNCLFDSREQALYALLGDSKSGAIFSAVVQASKEHERWMFVGGFGPDGVPVPYASPDPIWKKFQINIERALEMIESNRAIQVVAIATSTRKLFHLKNEISISDLVESKNEKAVLEGMNTTIDRFIKAGKKIILVVDNPTLAHPEDCMGRKTSIAWINKVLLTRENPDCQISMSEHLRLSKKYRDVLQELQVRHPRDVKIFDTLKILCEESKEECLHYKNGRALYGTTDHVSGYGAKLIAESLVRELEGF